MGCVKSSLLLKITRPDAAAWRVAAGGEGGSCECENVRRSALPLSKVDSNFTHGKLERKSGNGKRKSKIKGPYINDVLFGYGERGTNKRAMTL